MEELASRKTCLLMVAIVVALLAVPALANAKDVKVKADKKVEERETVYWGDLNGYILKLEEDAKVSWRVNHFSGEKMDILFMPKNNYEQLKSGQGTPWHYKELSEENTDFIERTLKVKSPYIGDFVIVVRTQDVENASTTYDIEIKLEKAPEPLGLLDQLCALGTTTCIALAFVAVVVVVIVLYLARKVGGERRGDGRGEGEVKYVDTMMRPGLDIPILPEPEPRKRKRKKAKRRKGVKGRKKRRKKKRPPREEALEVEVVEAEAVNECPQCGEELEEGSDFCLSCGSGL